MFRWCRNMFALQAARRSYNVDLKTLHGTLHLRFFEHLRQNHKLKSDSKLAMMIQLFQDNPLQPSKEYFERCRQIDDECLYTLSDSKTQETYALLDVLIRAMPERVTDLQAFPEAVKKLIRGFKWHPTKDAFVKLCFYLGLLKKKPPGASLLTTLTEHHLDEFISGMNTLDFAIVCTAMYKASVRTSSSKFQQRLIDELLDAKEIDEFIFIVFIKSLRQNQINSPLVMEKLKNLHAKGELNKLDFKALIHLFPLIADNSIKDEKLSSFIIERCVETMDVDVRAKDVQKLLYSCALLNHPVDLTHLQKMEKLVMARIQHKEFSRKFDSFVDIALSMWMLNFRCRELVETLMKDSRFKSTGDRNRIKLDSRKKLLLTCVEIEEPEWVRHLEIKSPSFNEERPAPKFLVKASLQRTMSSLKKQDARFVQQIENLNIAGILIRKTDGGNVHIEVLDSTNSLSDKKSPNGIFALKLRLLESAGCQVEVVSSLLLLLAL